MLFERRSILVKERVAVLKLTDTFDLFDAESGTPIGIAREEPSSLAKFARLIVKKQFLPTTVNVYASETQPPALSMHKKPGFFRHTVTVSVPARGVVGVFRSKFFSIGGGFFIQDLGGRKVGEIKGDWKGWNFTYLDAAGREVGVVTKKWAGIGKELFTSADNYIVSVTDPKAQARDLAPLLLAAGLAIDVVFKERQ